MKFFRERDSFALRQTLSIAFATLRWAVIVVVIIGAGLSLPGGFAMPPQNIAEHAITSSAEAEPSETHGHVHEDDQRDLPMSADHAGNHDSADHSHETPSTPPSVLISSPLASRQWESPRLFIARLGTSFRLDRPPRSAAAA